MKAISPLKETLKHELGWNQARITFLSHFLLALICKESVNLKKVAKAFYGKAQVASNYRRINRFFQKYELDYSQIARLLVSLFDLPDRWVLSLDRTNWKFGQLNINILMLSITYQGTAIPVIWNLLPKRGNSNSDERIEIIERFVRIFGKERIACLTGDREFIGETWLTWLEKQQILFCIRIRKNILVQGSRSTNRIPVYRLFSGLKQQEFMILNQSKLIMGVHIRMIGLRVKGDWVILITNDNPQYALSNYKRRWEIETLFGCLKSRGFNLEDTHLNQLERINKLVALLSIAFAWAYRIGIWMNQIKAIKLKKHGRLAQSIFRYGLDWLIQILFNISDRKSDFRFATKFLSST